MLTVAVAGATGFIGRSLCEQLVKKYKVVGLSRRPGVREANNEIEWRTCDLFSLLDAEKALQGVDIAFYLVHSMMPSASLTQGSFEDMDLIVADNFARAAQKNKVKQIVYVGGIIPRIPEENLSRHLRSRHEVERTLSSHQIPLTTIRCSLVIGAGGPSFEIMRNLVSRLPVMICPKWTNSLTQPIALDDLVKALVYCVNEEKTFGEVFELGINQKISYRILLRTLAQAMHKKRFMPSVPLFSVRLSRLWLSLITGAPGELVRPLVESLKHPMVTEDRRLATLARIPEMDIVTAFNIALAREPKKAKKFHRAPEGRSVRSVQRMILPPGRRARWVARQYMFWLPHVLPWLIRVTVHDETVTFCFPFFKSPLLILKLDVERSSIDRQLFRIQGGSLALIEGRGRLEFREILGGKYVLAAIHEFRPRLPWLIYSFSQARVHSWIMKMFGEYLQRYGHKNSEPLIPKI